MKQALSPSTRHRCSPYAIAARAGSQVTTPSASSANAAPACAGWATNSSRRSSVGHPAVVGAGSGAVDVVVLMRGPPLRWWARQEWRAFR